MRSAPGYERAVVDRLRSLAAQFWAITLVFFGIGDVATTLVGLSLAGVVEAGPVAAPLIDAHGTVPMLLALKTATLGGCYLVWRLSPEPYDVGIPLGLATLGTLSTSWNLALIVALAVRPL